jgi:hypothetical protein
MLTTYQSLAGQRMSATEINTRRQSLVETIVKRDEPSNEDLSDRSLLPVYREHQYPPIGYILCFLAPNQSDRVLDKLYISSAVERSRTDLGNSIEDALQDVFSSWDCKVLISTLSRFAWPGVYNVEQALLPAHWDVVTVNGREQKQHKRFRTTGQPGPSETDGKLRRIAPKPAN